MAMAHEIKDYLIGPMSVDLFFNSFLPKPAGRALRSNTRFTPGCYNTTVRARTEPEAYDPFVSDEPR